MIHLDYFKKKAKINPEGQTIKFVCMKCNSEDIKIETTFDYKMGSEYTGIYGEQIQVLFKCMKCGNAWGITK